MKTKKAFGCDFIKFSKCTLYFKHFDKNEARSFRIF